MLPRRRRERQPAGVGAVVAGADVRRVGRADCVVDVMDVMDMHVYRNDSNGHAICVGCGVYQDNAAGRNCATIRKLYPGWRDTYVSVAQFNLPPDNCIPDTARRILDLGRTQQAAPVPQQPVDERAAGVARAVRALTSHEPRLGCHAWRP
jgi:hypothetical protein